MRSAEAAKQIKALIGESAGSVQSGSALVNQAGRTMQEIVGSVKSVSGLIADIAVTSREQSSGLTQVNSAVTQMETMTQENAAMVEQAAAAAAALQEQAEKLNGAVNVFKLAEAEAAPQLKRVEAPEPAAEAQALRAVAA
jgi:methyl-accepting chemotaxis protein